MEEFNGIFIIGNKRSGSTQLMRLLNLHPNVFVSNETDIIWILYHFHNDLSLKKYPHDSPTGMQESLKIGRDILKKENSVRQNFYNFQRFIMEKGFLRGGTFTKNNLFYIGDQKPYQNGDPALVSFILEHFPKAKFIHLIRHPFLVAESSKNFLNGKNDIWEGLSDEELMDKWYMHESNVKEIIEKHKIDFIRIKYSDLIFNTKREMTHIFNFLGLNYSTEMLIKARKMTKLNLKPIKNYKLKREHFDLLEEYSFKSNFGIFEAKILPFFFVYYNKIIRKMGFGKLHSQ